VYMCTVLLPPGGYPIEVKYIISYRIVHWLNYWRTNNKHTKYRSTLTWSEL